MRPLALMLKTEILVCTTCRPPLAASDMPPAGRTLLEAVSEVIKVAAHAGFRPVPRLRGIACLSGCGRACTMALQAPGKHTYVFGDLQADAETAVQVLACAVLHQQSEDGSLPHNARPSRLRKGILVKLPPPEGDEEEPL